MGLEEPGLGFQGLGSGQLRGSEIFFSSVKWGGLALPGSSQRENVGRDGEQRCAGGNVGSCGAPTSPGEACNACHTRSSGKGLKWGLAQSQRGVKAVESGGGRRCLVPRVSGLSLGQHRGPLNLLDCRLQQGRTHRAGQWEEATGSWETPSLNLSSQPGQGGGSRGMASEHRVRRPFQDPPSP